MQMQCSRNRLSRTASELENIFQQVFGPSASSSSPFTPPGDVFETDTSYQVNLELPGVQLENISLEFVDDLLKVSGEKKIVGDEAANACHCSERRSGSFQRSFRFPTEVETEKVTARFEDGLLLITLPKAAKAMPRKIQIQGNN